MKNVNYSDLCWRKVLFFLLLFEFFLCLFSKIAFCSSWLANSFEELRICSFQQISLREEKLFFVQCLYSKHSLILYYKMWKCCFFHFFSFIKMNFSNEKNMGFYNFQTWQLDFKLFYFARQSWAHNLLRILYYKWTRTNRFG